MMDDLFAEKPKAPLAEELRPADLRDVAGQTHLLGTGKPLRLALDAGHLHSFVLWGPPGTGKTTIARLAAKASGADFITLSAVTDGVKQIREAVVRAQSTLNMRQKRTVVFIDEIHRLNKSQQDELLPPVEAGVISLVAATTEDVGFSLNSGLLSRLQVYTLKRLTEDDFRSIYSRAMQLTGAARLEEPVIKSLISMADGDGRRFLNLLETLQAVAKAAGLKTVSLEFAQESLGEKIHLFDRAGQQHYDLASAFQKCIRGSDPNAALYWLARMLGAGEDPLFIARRLIVIASEDVGNADTRALPLAVAALDAYKMLGAAEGDRALAQAAVYLAAAPKSNALYSAWNAAKAFVAAGGSEPVPLHIRNAPTKFAKEQGHKAGYRYAHDEPNGYAAGECYFPDGVEPQNWYQPTDRGEEIDLGDRMRQLASLDVQAAKNGQSRREY